MQNHQEPVRRLRRRFRLAVLGLLIALTATVAATFAWYIYNTSAHTTKVKLAAGTSINLQISNQREGRYESATTLSPAGQDESFVGILTPVSTNDVRKGFQKATNFEPLGTGTGLDALWANAFGFSSPEEQDYYKTALYLRTNAPSADVYIANMDYGQPSADGTASTKTEQDRLMSSAMRIGFAVYASGSDEQVIAQYIFSLNEDDHIDNPLNNTAPGQDQPGSFVMDPTNPGQTVAFTPLNTENYCLYDPDTSAASATEKSTKLCTLTGLGSDYGEATRMDVYLWLEGCDPDCTNELCSMTLHNLSIIFAGVSSEEEGTQ
ncbi:MAG: hypothetical protein PUD80_01890 [Firmicutes bacterium]|nr:hypothetical protein [Bacillota bacterium]